MSFGVKQRHKKDKDFLHTAWGIQQKLELSKPWGLCNPLGPACPPRQKMPDRGQSCSAGLEDGAGGTPAGGTWDLLEKQLSYIQFLSASPPFLRIKRDQDFLLIYLYIFIFHYTMSSPCLWRINSSIHGERTMGLPTKPPSPERNTWDYTCSYYGAGFGFYVCLVL